MEALVLIQRGGYQAASVIANLDWIWMTVRLQDYVTFTAEVTEVTQLLLCKTESSSYGCDRK